MPKLKHPSLRQKRFVDEYRKTGKAKHSAIVAGYAPKYANVQGYKLLNDKNLLRFIARSGEIGLDVLNQVAIEGKVEVARVMASKELVERAYGKAKSNDLDKKTVPNITLVFNRVDVPDTTPNTTQHVIDV